MERLHRLQGIRLTREEKCLALELEHAACLGEYVRKLAEAGGWPRGQIARILAGHDVFLFTSVYEEPIARSVMEAMAAGLAVLGTRVGRRVEMLEDGVNALIFAPEDAAALAEAILWLQRDPALRGRLAGRSC